MLGVPHSTPTVWTRGLSCPGPSATASASFPAGVLLPLTLRAPSLHLSCPSACSLLLPVPVYTLSLPSRGASLPDEGVGWPGLPTHRLRTLVTGLL